MIQVDPAVVYNKFFFYRESCEATFRANVTKIEEERRKFESFPWWKRWWLGGVDKYLWDFAAKLPQHSNASPTYLTDNQYKGLIAACEYAILHNIPKINLPSKYCHILRWPEQ